MLKTFASILAAFSSACLIGGSPQNSNDEDIIGGVVDQGDPSVVSIFAHLPGATEGSLCTGSVIAPYTVLTAAHCVDPAAVGAGNVFEVYPGPTFGAEAPLAVAATDYDQGFDPNNVANGHDVGIVTLAAPTSLAPLPYNRGDLGAGDIRLVGYGADSHINYPGIPNGAGMKRQVTTYIDSATGNQVTIGDSGHQTCHGDSGGPAFQTINGQEVIVGITSFGSDISSIAVCWFGSTDTRVDAYLPFIDSHLR
jgi:secreted trypsin-like serine protease